jgi:drug/metabolite transporter (DMT)-like permease
MVLAGVAVLADVQWRQLRLGRGELETLASSFFFTGQILWLERPAFAHNRRGPVTVVMFAAIALLSLPAAALLADNSRKWLPALGSPAAATLVFCLALGPTLASYSLMNYWQPHLPATNAALIYCCEPLFTSLFALFLPACLSVLPGIDYPNETIGWRLLVGGGLITGANLLVLWRDARAARLGPILPAPGAD